MELLVGALLGVGAIVGLLAASYAHDLGFFAHGLLFFGFCAAGVFWLVRRNYDALEGRMPDAPARPGAVAYNDAVARAGVIAATFWGVVGFAAGLYIALQLGFRRSTSTCPGPPSAGCGRCTHLP